MVLGRRHPETPVGLCASWAVPFFRVPFR
jgi:hypothetical protein